MARTQTELLERFREVSLCQLADAMGASWPIETSIRPIDPQFRICGPAETVLCEPDDNWTVHHGLHLAQAGCILVVSGSGSCGAALWGELMSISAQAKGLSGTIIDGAARDPLEIKALAYPVFSRGITPRKAMKEKYGQLDIPVPCGSLVVNPGDIIFADANGILALPQARAAEALQKAVEVSRKEKEAKEQIRIGRTLFDLLGLDKRLPKKKGR